MTTDTTPTGAALVDAAALREQVREKYRAVAETPRATFHFHTGRFMAARCGYDARRVDALPDAAVESFAGVANPFALRALRAGERVVDVGSGGGFDSFMAAAAVGPGGQVVGVDMTPEMLARSRSVATGLGLANLEFRAGLAEELPVEDGWADVVISNGVINLVADKRAAFAEIHRVLRPGGVLQFADIANGQPVPEAAVRDIDLWTAWIAGGLPRAGWQKMLEEAGFVDVRVGDPVDTFGGASGEGNARRFEVYGYPFACRRP